MEPDPWWFHIFVHLPALWCLRLLDWICRLLHLPSPIYGARSPDYQGCHLVRIVWRSILKVTWLPSLDHYVVLHEDWVNPDYILKHDNVTLYGVSRSHVWFCVSNPDIDVYSSSFSFVLHAQHFSAEKLVILPIEYFHQLADKVGDPIVPVTILNNMGRCGSTLVCQMLSRVPRIRVMSEPWAHYCLQDRYSKGQFTLDGYRRLLVNICRMQCKKENVHQIDHILLKPPFTCVTQMEEIRSLLPQIRHIFLLRQPLAAIRSWMKMQAVGIGNDGIGDAWFHSNPLLPTLFQDQSPPTTAQMCAAALLFPIKAAREFEKGGPFLGVFTYEDLVKNEKAVEELMNLFNLSDDERVEAAKALIKDSQGNTFFSQNKLNLIKVGETALEDFDQIKTCFQMPNLDSDVDEFKKYIQG